MTSKKSNSVDIIEEISNITDNYEVEQTKLLKEVYSKSQED